MAMDDVEFVMKVVKADWQTREFIEQLLKLDECKDLRESTVIVENAFRALKDLAIQRYTEIVSAMKAREVTHAADERVKMQGGL